MLISIQSQNKLEQRLADLWTHLDDLVEPDTAYNLYAGSPCLACSHTNCEDQVCVHIGRPNHASSAFICLICCNCEGNPLTASSPEQPLDCISPMRRPSKARWQLQQALTVHTLTIQLAVGQTIVQKVMKGPSKSRQIKKLRAKRTYRPKAEA